MQPSIGAHALGAFVFSIRSPKLKMLENQRPFAAQADPLKDAIDAAKQEYSVHLRTLNPGATDEGAYVASCYYYRAELLPLLPADKSARILDVGCGFGHLIRFCAEHGYT